MCVADVLEAGGGLVGSLIGGHEQAKAAKRAAAQQEEMARVAAQRSTEQFNKANQKVPDIASLFNANQGAAGSGVGGTFLTGTSGVLPSALSLGKPALLGQ